LIQREQLTAQRDDALAKLKELGFASVEDARKRLDEVSDQVTDRLQTIREKLRET
jgi:hypothetical protein